MCAGLGKSLRTPNSQNALAIQSTVGKSWGDLQKEGISALGVSWMREAEACQVGDRLNRNLKRGRAQSAPGHYGTTTVSLGRKCETCSRINHPSRGQIWAASPICLCTICMQCLWQPGEGIRFPYDCCQLPCECQESSLCPLEEQPVLLIAEPFLSSLILRLSFLDR